MIIGIYVYQDKLRGKIMDFNLLAVRLLKEVQKWKDFTEKADGGKYPGLAYSCTINVEFAACGFFNYFTPQMANELKFAHALLLPQSSEDLSTPSKFICKHLRRQNTSGVEQVNLFSVPQSYISNTLRFINYAFDGITELPKELLNKLEILFVKDEPKPGMVLIQIQAHRSMHFIECPYAERLSQVRERFDLTGYRSPITLPGGKVVYVQEYVEQLAYKWLKTGNPVILAKMERFRKQCAPK